MEPPTAHIPEVKGQEPAGEGSAEVGDDFDGFHGSQAAYRAGDRSEHGKPARPSG